MNTSANYKAIPLTGTMGEDVLGNGVTGTSVHQVYCLAAGAIQITAAGLQESHPHDVLHVADAPNYTGKGK